MNGGEHTSNATALERGAGLGECHDELDCNSKGDKICDTARAFYA